jgi:hypothetical protein
MQFPGGFLANCFSHELLRALENILIGQEQDCVIFSGCKTVLKTPLL